VRRARFGAVALAGLVAAATAATPSSSSTASASAATCGHAVIAAWSSSTLGANFAPRCYTWALQHLPADVEGYSSAASDIEGAMLKAIRKAAAQRTHGVAAASKTIGPGRYSRPLFLAVVGIAAAAAAVTFIAVLRR
jgi:hypothetical protein